MNIIISEEKDTRIIDGVNEILNLDNENFNKISNEYFSTKYQNYSYNITLVERAEK